MAIDGYEEYIEKNFCLKPLVSLFNEMFQDPEIQKRYEKWKEEREEKIR